MLPSYADMLYLLNSMASAPLAALAATSQATLLRELPRRQTARRYSPHRRVARARRAHKANRTTRPVGRRFVRPTAFATPPF